MARNHPITPKLNKIATEIIAWARSFLVPEHGDMIRPFGNKGEKKAGPVCPFIEPSLENDSFYLVFHPEINGKSQGDVEECLETYIELFKEMEPYSEERQHLKSLLIVFPDIPKDRFQVLTKAFSKLKPRFVENGLMLAPFYPTCDDRSIHNKRLLTSQTPYPLIALRHMAKHDILFLGGDKGWFNHYNTRFGHLFKSPDKLDEHELPLLSLYEDARKKHRSS